MLQFGFQVNPYYDGQTGNPWDAVETLGRLLDATAFESMWIFDHFLYEGGQPRHPDPEPVLECFSTLGALAAVTRRIRLGQLVVGVPYRNPALVAKMATTLDLISHGRSILGLGAGWHAREYEAYGWGAFEEPSVRLRRLEEAVQVIRTLWTERPADFKGTFYELHGVRDRPAPLQQPHPPIMIAGGGERVTLRLVAQYAQLCSVTGPPAEVERLFGVLRAHCERLGRAYAEITRTVLVPILLAATDAELARQRERLAARLDQRNVVIGTPAQVIDRLGAYAQVGCQTVVVTILDWTNFDAVQLFAEDVIPALQ